MTPFQITDTPTLESEITDTLATPVTGIPQSTANPLLDVFGQPDYRDDHEKAMDAWRQESATALDAAVIDPKSYGDERVPHGFTPEEWRKTRVVDDWMRLHTDGEEPPMGMTREFTRARLAEQVFGGAGAENDDAIFGEITKAATGRKDQNDLATELTVAAFDDAMLPGDKAPGYGAFREKLKAHAGYRAENEADYAEAWHETRRAAAEKVDEFREPLVQVWRAFKTDGNVTAAAYDAYSKLTPEQRPQFMDALAIRARALPDAERATFWANMGKATGQAVSDYGRNAAESFTSMGLAQPTDPMVGIADSIYGTDSYASAEAGRTKAKGEFQQARNFAADVRKVAREDYDPIQSAFGDGKPGFWENVAYQAPGVTATSLTMAVPVVGVATMAFAMEGQAYETLRGRMLASGLDDATATTYAEGLAPFVALPQVALEKVGYGIWSRKLPGFSKVMDTIGDKIANRALRFGAKTLTIGTAETGIELLQDVTNYAVQDIAAALTEDVPDVDWSKELSGTWAQAPEIFATMLPLAILGAAGGLNAEARQAAFARSSPTELEAFGISPDGIAAIQGAQGPASLASAIESAMETRDPNSETAQAAVGALKLQLASQRQAVEDLERLGYAAPTFTTTPEGVFVFDADGNELGMAQNYAGASRIAAAHTTALVNLEKDRVDALTTLMEGVKAAVALDKTSEMEVNFGEFDPAQATPGKAAQFARQVALMETAEGGTGDIARSVLGYSVTETVQGLRHTINRLFKNASIVTAFHETGHGLRRKALAAGTVTIAMEASLLINQDAVYAGRQVRDERGKQTGDKLRLVPEGITAAMLETGEIPAEMIPAAFHGDGRRYADTILDEGVSQILEAEVLKLRKGKGRGKLGITRELVQKNLQAMARLNATDAKSWKSFFAAVRGHWGLATARAIAMMGAERRGEFDPAERDAYLDKILGLDQQTEHDAGVQTELDRIMGLPDEIADDDIPFSIGRSTVTPTAGTRTFEGAAGSPSVIGPAAFSIGAWHGTPHKVDKFTTAKMGTGEGAQAYGWGLYFASLEAVAKGYKSMRADPLQTLGYYDKNIAALEEHLQRVPADDIARMQLDGMRADQQDAIGREGNLYRVTLKVKDEELLDWDKPLSEQSEKVRALLPTKALENASATVASEWYQKLTKHPSLAEETSKQLLAAGIRGIRYLDGNSRMLGGNKYKARWDNNDPINGTFAEVYEVASGQVVQTFDTFKEADAWMEANKGEGSYNYVIFSDSDIEIVEENGTPVDMGAASFSFSIGRVDTNSPGGANNAFTNKFNWLDASKFNGEWVATKGQGFRVDNLRPDGERNQRGGIAWASFDSKGNLLYTGNDHITKPRAEDLERAKKDALVLAEFWNGKGHEDGFIYIRFGEIPETGRSINHSTGKLEKGVSSYEADRDVFGRYTVYLDGLKFPFFGASVMNERKAYLIKGKVIGEGGDGDALLKNATIVKELTPAEVKAFYWGNYESMAEVLPPVSFQSAPDGRLATNGSGSTEGKENFNESPPADSGAFSIGPAQVAGILSDNALARITDPRRRTYVMSRIARDFNAMRLQIDRMASLSGVRRSKGDLRREAMAREDLRAEELIGDVHRRFGEIMADEDLVKIKSQPVHAALADPDSPLRGRLKSKAAAIREHPDMFQLHRAGDYDGSDGVSRSVFGGQRMPDQAAQELYDEGLISEPTADALWEALLSEQKTVKGMKELLEKAKEQIREAKAQAKQEANEWLATQGKDQEVNFSDKEEIRRSLRMLDAILLALPPEIRGKIGGYTQISMIASDEARLAYLKDKLAKADRELEAFLRVEYAKEWEELLKKAAPKTNEAGQRPTGSIAADAYDVFRVAEHAMGLSFAEGEAEADKWDAIADHPDTDPKDVDLARVKAQMIRLTMNWHSADAARREQAVLEGDKIYFGGLRSLAIENSRRRERLGKLRDSAVRGTGKTGHRMEREAAKQEGATKLGAAKAMVWEFLSFGQVVNVLFGEKSDAAKWMNSREIAASNGAHDGFQAKANALESLFDTLSGNRFDGEKLRHRMATDPRIKVKDVLGVDHTFTESQAIDFLLTYRQEDGKRHMHGIIDDSGAILSEWAWDDKIAATIEAGLSAEGRAAMAFLGHSYGEEYSRINAVFRRIWNVMMPRHKMYAPISAKPVQGKGDTIMDPQSGDTMGSGMTPNSLRNRSFSAISEIEFKDAFQKYLQHARQMEHFIAYAEFSRDALGIINRRETRNAIEAAGGADAAAVLSKWVDYFALGGVHGASMGGAWNKIMGGMLGRLSQAALVGRVSVLCMQSLQLAAASFKMPTGAFLTRFAKLTAGRLQWGDTIQSEYVQRRVQQLPPVVRDMMQGMASGTPNRAKFLAGKVAMTIPGADALFTAGTYAMFYDYHLGLAKKDRTIANPEAHAHAEAERLTDQVAQPVRTGARSWLEVANAGNPAFRAAWNFSSDPRQKMSLLVYAAMRRDTTGKEKVADVAFTAAKLWIIGGVLQTLLRTVLRDLRNDDDDEIFDERYWSPARLALQVGTGPLGAVPFLGGMMEDATYKATGQFMPQGGMLAFLDQAAGLPKKWAGGKFEPIKDVEALTTAGAGLSGTSAAAASAMHLIRDVVGFIENLEGPD